MQVINEIKEMQNKSDTARRQGKTVGFVPTMGYFHDGHLSLIRLMRAKCDLLVVSIFVNPTQFGENEDFDAYPRDFERDKEMCGAENVDIVFHPSPDRMYIKPFRTSIAVGKLTETMCGISRPGHFQGVATIVAKLFNIVKPHYAIFGEKDFQQMLVIRQMAKELNFDVEIVTGAIVREADGLAMSSRNQYLTVREREHALVLQESLRLAQKLVGEGVRSPGMVKMQMEQLMRSLPDVIIDYIAIVDAETLEPVNEIGGNTLIALAAYVGDTRLIDNVVIKNL